MRKEASLAMFTCVTAAVSSFIRWVQNNNIYERSTGLVRPSIWNNIMLAACAFTVIGLAFLTFRLKNSDARGDYRTALRARTILFPAAALILGVGMVAGAFMLIRGRGDSMYPNLNLILAVFAVLCGASFPALALGPKKDSSGAFICVCSVMPVFFFCCWLVICYRENSANPVLWSFAFEILAICAAALGFYYLAGYAFQRAKPYHTIFFSQLGAFLCIVALGDDRILAKQLFLLTSGLMLLMQSTVLTARMKTTE